LFYSRCGYCNEEIYTRYAATYHNKYKHPGEPRNFIKDEQDVSIYYVNRAKKNGSTASFTSLPTSISSQHSSKNDEELADINSKNQLVKSNINLNSSPASHFQSTSHEQTDDMSLTNANKQAKKQKKSHTDSSSNGNNSSTTSSSSNQSHSNNFNSTDSSKTSNSQLSSNGNQSNNNQYAAALTQLMLNNALTGNNSAVNPIQSLLNNPAGGFLNNTPNGACYDFNLALKMYQIQLQSLMTANYLQSMRPNQQAAASNANIPNASLFSSLLGLGPEQLKQLSSGAGMQSGLGKPDESDADNFKSDGMHEEAEQDEESDEFESASLKNVKICINEVNSAGSNGKLKQLDSRNSNKNSVESLKKFKNGSSNERNPKLIKNK
jgi:hypothetical protein